MKKSLVIGAIVGGLAASVTSLLFAPKTGKELRGKIQEKYQEVKIIAQTKLEETKASKEVIADVQLIEEEATEAAATPAIEQKTA